MQLINANL